MKSMLDIHMLKLYCLRARIEAPNIISQCSKELGVNPIHSQPGCSIRCNGLVSSSLLPNSQIHVSDASTIASSITCMERAFVIHTSVNNEVLVGDALLARVFRHMGTLDTAIIEFLAITADNLIRDSEKLEFPTISIIEQSPASRNAWVGALAFCGINNTDPFSISLSEQKQPSLKILNDITGIDRETRDMIITQMTQNNH